VEELDFVTETFESALVINATITNELKHHKIFVSRTYPFEEDGPIPESGATVRVIGNGADFIFEETEAGTYSSTTAFAAAPNIDYQLQIQTANGRLYTSSTTQLTQTTQIDALYVEREANDDGVNGMSIYLDSFNPSGNARYYRYEYEETFKIIAPDWKDKDLVVIDQDPNCLIPLVDRPEEQRICYRTETSQSINQTNTANLAEDRISKHLVRFVRSDDYKISHRYSVLARQYVQSQAAYEYLETLSKFSNEGSLFSQIQPGFINGNIISETNASEKVIGFFEVSSVDEMRLFFNYDDYYPNEALPPYVDLCQVITPRVCDPRNRVIQARTLVFFDKNEDDTALFKMVPRVCGDCTAIGNSEPPTFWTE
jgi:hypothetical protein